MGAEKISESNEQTTVPDSLEGMVGTTIRPPSPKVVPPAAMEEDKVEEIMRDEPRPQAVWILRKRGEEIVIVEEEDTTKEFKRLETSLTGVMKQIKEISRVAEQRRQLIKRMEPLATENEKLKEARNLSEKNIQRAQRERDLAESNVRDLEYQKGVLTEKLAAASEQVRSQSEQLAAISDQLKCASERLERKKQDAELSQMRQTIDQLRQEKAKEAERATKLVEELKDYRHKAKAQFDVLMQEAKHNGRRQHPDTVIQRCKATWENFKTFNRDAITTVATHVLAVVWSHYPTINLQSIEGGFAEGLSNVETQQLEDEVEDAAKMLASDIDLFGEMDGDGRAH
ncbi:uncharacterized protein [Miscanthus floridulus]|uniref:uncharacterized protein n=1 Tax=Miscanthus floridulus TaxID=154761 RepID=UPI00345A85DA